MVQVPNRRSNADCRRTFASSERANARDRGSQLYHLFVASVGGTLIAAPLLLIAFKLNNLVLGRTYLNDDAGIKWLFAAGYAGIFNVASGQLCRRVRLTPIPTRLAQLATSCVVLWAYLHPLSATVGHGRLLVVRVAIVGSFAMAAGWLGHRIAYIHDPESTRWQLADLASFEVAGIELGWLIMCGASAYVLFLGISPISLSRASLHQVNYGAFACIMTVTIISILVSPNNSKTTPEEFM